MKKIHIFAPQNHSNRSVCDVGKMASHSFVTRHCEAVQRHDYSNIEYIYAADGTKLRISIAQQVQVPLPTQSTTLVI